MCKLCEAYEDGYRKGAVFSTDPNPHLKDSEARAQWELGYQYAAAFELRDISKMSFKTNGACAKED